MDLVMTSQQFMMGLIALPFLMLLSAAIEQKLRDFHRQGMARVARFDEREKAKMIIN
jgi:hypothetical protein